MIPAFKTSTIRIYRIVEVPDETHPYGDPKREKQLIAEVEADVQALSPREVVKEHGDYSANIFRFFIPLDVDVQYDDRIEADLYPNIIFRVRGEPEKRPILGYQRVLAEKQERGQV
jgi:hypothetical protein